VLYENGQAHQRVSQTSSTKANHESHGKAFTRYVSAPKYETIPFVFHRTNPVIDNLKLEWQNEANGTGCGRNESMHRGDCPFYIYDQDYKLEYL